MNQSAIDIQQLGDRAFLLRWKEQVESSTVAGMARALAELILPWLQEVVPASRTIAFYMKSGEYDMGKAAEEAVRLLQGIKGLKQHRLRHVELPVIYGGDAGPDLAECARRSGLSIEQFVDRHAETRYEVAMIGFAPGFPYLSGLHDSLAQPRRDTPRMSVQAGSVGIAGNRTGVYSVSSPGGWQIIGRTPVPLFRPEAERPFLLAQGDTVKFIPVSADAEIPVVPNEPTPAFAHDSGSGERISNSALSVIKPGLLTTIQDLGRTGWQAYGVSVGGAMDETSMRKANLLLGNEEAAAVLELTLIGGSYLVESDILIAICGADLRATVDGAGLPLNKPILLRGGTRIDFGSVLTGCRAYVAIAGGFDAPLVLGSRSTDPRARIGGGFGRALIAGDTIGVMPLSPLSRELMKKLGSKADDSGLRWSETDWSAKGWEESLPFAVQPLRKPLQLTIRVLLGAEWEQFAKESKATLFEEPFKVDASSDRMGMRLSGHPLKREFEDELESRGVVPGTIQVPPSGQPIILTAGCQPTGGYPIIAHVIRADIPLLAQAAPGDLLTFEFVDLITAERALRHRERDIAILKAGVRIRARG
ncbi:5-oxoprolinase subunit PxpB [Cohnella endophytica]|nr:5-oxoprolinase subunit PxpB [Cohnella endophytica]